MYRNPERIGREERMEITAEVQDNYPNFNQNLAEKEKFVISKASRFSAIAVSEQQGSKS